MNTDFQIVDAFQSHSVSCTDHRISYMWRDAEQSEKRSIMEQCEIPESVIPLMNIEELQQYYELKLPVVLERVRKSGIPHLNMSDDVMYTVPYARELGLVSTIHSLRIFIRDGISHHYQIILPELCRLIKKSKTWKLLIEQYNIIVIELTTHMRGSVTPSFVTALMQLSYSDHSLREYVDKILNNVTGLNYAHGEMMTIEDVDTYMSYSEDSRRLLEHWAPHNRNMRVQLHCVKLGIIDRLVLDNRTDVSNFTIEDVKTIVGTELLEITYGAAINILKLAEPDKNVDVYDALMYRQNSRYYIHELYDVIVQAYRIKMPGTLASLTFYLKNHKHIFESRLKNDLELSVQLPVGFITYMSHRGIEVSHPPISYRRDLDVDDAMILVKNGHIINARSMAKIPAYRFRSLLNGDRDVGITDMAMFTLQGEKLDILRELSVAGRLFITLMYDDNIPDVVPEDLDVILSYFDPETLDEVIDSMLRNGMTILPNAIAAV